MTDILTRLRRRLAARLAGQLSQVRRHLRRRRPLPSLLQGRAHVDRHHHRR